MRRVIGAGKRNATSASVNARPGLSSGAIHASRTRLAPTTITGSEMSMRGSACSSGGGWRVPPIGMKNIRRKTKNQK